MTFQEFLKKKGPQAHARERRERRDEWIQAVRQLCDQMIMWLEESDPGRILDVIPIEVQVVEPSLGVYRTAGLKISLGDSSVQIAPVGRNAIGLVGQDKRSEGRVDITEGIRRFILYRTIQDAQSGWYALDERFQETPLDKSRFEAILQDLLA